VELPCGGSLTSTCSDLYIFGCVQGTVNDAHLTVELRREIHISWIGGILS
jgi:hypothetical protein